MGERGPKPSMTVVNFRPGVPDPPDWLTSGARQEYDRVISEMEEHPGILQQLDYAHLVTYCVMMDKCFTMMQEIEQEGVVSENENGPKKNEKIMALNSFNNLMFRSATKLGLSPMDRGRYPPTGNKAEKSNLHKFMRKTKTRND